jgi:hypothetical protein
MNLLFKEFFTVFNELKAPPNSAEELYSISTDPIFFLSASLNVFSVGEPTYEFLTVFNFISSGDISVRADF